MPIYRHYHNNVLVAEREVQSTAQDVKDEAQRRIMALFGATDMTHCIVKQLNANMRANELNDIRADRSWTEQEAAEAQALRTMAAAIKAIRAASDVIEQNPPLEVEKDSRWP